jgi:carbon-monoxide dehydrogenase large subunit
LTGSLLDYGIPRADMLPAIRADFSPVPSTTNPLGVKGVGEGGTVASTPTVINAILDALAPLGVTDLAMPATPERIWRAIRKHARG